MESFLIPGFFEGVPHYGLQPGNGVWASLQTIAVRCSRASCLFRYRMSQIC